MVRQIPPRAPSAPRLPSAALAALHSPSSPSSPERVDLPVDAMNRASTNAPMHREVAGDPAIERLAQAIRLLAAVAAATLAIAVLVLR